MRFPAGRKRPQARYLRRSRFNGARGTIQLIGFDSLRGSLCHNISFHYISFFKYTVQEKHLIDVPFCTRKSGEESWDVLERN